MSGIINAPESASDLLRRSTRVVSNGDLRKPEVISVSITCRNEPWRKTKSVGKAKEMGKVVREDQIAEPSISARQLLPFPCPSLDAPRICLFTVDQVVWFKNYLGEWQRGKIYASPAAPQGRRIRASDNHIYWNVIYVNPSGHKLRRWFTPVNGDIKPDTPDIRALLNDGGWLDDCDET
ncbi:unnamed protein product [Mycena citricolor]|uniref:Uncharacterized protein n=1 Tax=Mycena citricolor TaxID=2018698 RepID=A0AAD2H0Q7_9AGAR|nr:unnamed protein product [Mycena citricolor]